MTSVLAIGGLACAKDPFRPPAGPPPFAFNTVDFSPTWSRDGRWIAYRRVYPSSDGPPGIYVIGRLGGEPRFITGANFTWPADLSFSPDGRYLAAAIDLQLAIIDLTTGAVSIPMYTDNRVRFPDWSPDGRYIAYSRLVIEGGEPFDSAGVHLFEVATGRDWPLVHEDQVVLGREPRWAPGGEWIAFVTGSPATVSLVRPDGSERQTLHTSDILIQSLRWYRRKLTGADGVIFVDYCCGTYFVDISGAQKILIRQMGPYDEFSPDGATFVTIGLQQPDSLGLLFTQSVDDVSGATRFQLTRYAPPPPSSTGLAPERESHARTLDPIP